MKEDNKNPFNWTYFIDDSKMPSPQEVEKFPKTPELDKELEEEVILLAKEFGVLK